MDDPDLLSKYFADYLNKGFRRIFEEQRRIAANKIYGKQAYRTDGTPQPLRPTPGGARQSHVLDVGRGCEPFGHDKLPDVYPIP